jgi:glycine/D-amino acid oxidase-like deaminating enzyme
VSASRNYWLEGLSDPVTVPLAGNADVDVVVIGGGYTGLWTALQLRERDAGLRIMVCEAEVVGHGASGRNGGFCDPSLTHGLANGLRHFPDEIRELETLGADSYRGMRRFLDEHAVDCDLEPTGMIDLAVAPWQVADLREATELHHRFGQQAELLEGARLSEHIRSPMVLAGLRRPDGGAVLHPAKLAVGLRRVAREQGIAVHERTPLTDLRPVGAGVAATAPGGTVRAAHAVLATNAYSAPLLARTRRHFVPVYDYVLVSEPLTADQLAAIGWKHREGLADAGNQFHYFRLTADDRILWGGYDAVYRYGGAVGPAHDADRTTFARLEAHFVQMFPDLAAVRFPYRWGGAIATTTRFTPVFGEALDGRVHYALGYTGLGVAATRFAGRVLAERICDPSSPLLRLRYTTTQPFPFPPEPLRWVGVQLVRSALAKADRREGRRGPLLQVLDRLGIGFDS